MREVRPEDEYVAATLTSTRMCGSSTSARGLSRASAKYVAGELGSDRRSGHLAHCARVREGVEKLLYKAELHAKRQRLNDAVLAGDVYVHLDLFPSLHKVRQPREHTRQS
jgi:hypothetical protein